MSIDVVIDAMRELEFSDADILAVVQKIAERKAGKARANNAERQRRFRERNAHNAITPVTRDSVTPSSPYKDNRAEQTARADALIPVGSSIEDPPVNTSLTPPPSPEPAAAPAARCARLGELFERFYRAYPKHVARKSAERRFEAAVRSGEDPERIISAAAAFAAASLKAKTEPRYIPAPDVWLNKGRYLDEDLPGAEAQAGPLMARPLPKPAIDKSRPSPWAKGGNGHEDSQRNTGGIRDPLPGAGRQHEDALPALLGEPATPTRPVLVRFG